MNHEIEPREYDADPNVHGALRAIETQLMALGPMLAQAIEDHAVGLANAMNEQTEATRQVADALNRVADALGAIAHAIPFAGTSD